MILFLAYALFIIAFIQAIIVIYNIVCCITLRLFKKEVDESTESNLENRKTRFNIYIGLIKISRKIKRVTSPNELKKEVKKQVIGKTFLAIFLSFSLIISAIQSFTYGLVVYELNNQLQTVAGAFNILLSGDKDCPCYARCTGNSDDDGRSVYELIFGYDEYVKLTDAMVLTDEEYELFYGVGRYGEELEMQEGAHGEYLKSYNEVVLSMDGKSQSEFIRDHINDDMVNVYQQAIFAKNNNIRNDGFDRKKAEVDDLRKDLYNLLSDYKVNGRNPNCKCNTVSQKLLGNVCMGCDHWHEGWMWNTIYYNDDPTLGGGTGGPGGGILPDPDYPTISGGGAQNSTYGIKLDDGWYYWYQQRKCSCKHNPVDPTYGSYAHLYLNHPNGANPCGNNQAAARGCSTYSTSMAISNALGMEVTPYVLLKDIVGGSFVPVGGGYEFTGIGAGLNLSKAPPDLDIVTLGNKAVQLYGYKGLQFKKINNGNKTELDAALDDGYFVVVSVRGGPSPWYSGAGHYIVLRKRVGDKYYCLDSNCNDKQAYARMTTPVSWAALSSCMATHGGCGGAFKGPGIQAEDTGNLADGLKQDAMAFYSKCNIGKGSPVKALSGAIQLYNGLPWDSVGAYQLNNATVDSYISKYIGGTMKQSIVIDNNCSASGITSDGVVCADFAGYPILGFCNIDDAGQPIGWGTSTRPKKCAVILSDASGATYYLPLTCVGDAKGHAWPGGLCQTFLSNGKHTNGNWNFNSDGGNITGTIIGKPVTNIKDILNGYSTVKYRGSSVYPQLNLEVNSAIKSALSGYKVKGFISWE